MTNNTVLLLMTHCGEKLLCFRNRHFFYIVCIFIFKSLTKLWNLFMYTKSTMSLGIFSQLNILVGWFYYLLFKAHWNQRCIIWCVVVVIFPLFLGGQRWSPFLKETCRWPRNNYRVITNKGSSTLMHLNVGISSTSVHEFDIPFRILQNLEKLLICILVI